MQFSQNLSTFLQIKNRKRKRSQKIEDRFYYISIEFI
jgi:hypothetical protein